MFEKNNPCFHRLNVALSIIPWNDSEIIMVKTYRGKFWEFPGGRLKPGESFLEASVRKTYEETGLEVSPIGFIERYDSVSDTGLPVLVNVFCSKVIGGSLKIFHKEDILGLEVMILLELRF